jgi:hypothetical protein
MSPPEQARAVPSPHVPAPLQAPAGLNEFVLPHVAVPHVVPEGVMRQDPAPLQEPSTPQALPSGAHSLSGSCPVGTLAHLPSF